eukprot:3716733-Prymnesium_polylepis.1
MQLFQLFRVVLDVAPRAACSAPSRRSLARAQTPSDAAAAEGEAPAPLDRVARPEEVRADGAAPRANARQRR